MTSKTNWRKTFDFAVKKAAADCAVRGVNSAKLIKKETGFLNQSLFYFIGQFRRISLAAVS